jgi:toxin ParE1/3/4
VTEPHFKVVWTEVAARDFERLAGYLCEEAPLRAEALIGRILSKADSLRASPARGRAIPELRTVTGSAWREVQEPPWRILYRFGGKIVEIHGVLDGRRNLADILMERILDA